VNGSEKKPQGSNDLQDLITELLHYLIQGKCQVVSMITGGSEFSGVL
jgi:hypothetical protein